MKRAPVLIYHKIDIPDKNIRIRGAFTSPQRFARQLAYLKRKSFEFCTASELIERYLNDGRFPARSVALTLDDGWKDNYTNAFPILRDLGVRATIFLVPSCIGKVTATVVGAGEEAREHLSRENILEMSAGGIEFGSHSQNHKHLHRVSAEEAAFEASESKRQIEDLVQKPCRTFCYPAGFYNEIAREAVKNAGYIAAFTTVYGDDEQPDIYALNRIEILRRDRIPFRFARKIRLIVESG